MSFAGNKGRMQARQKASRRRLRRLEKKGKGDSDRAKRIRERMERREKKIDTRGGGREVMRPSVGIPQQLIIDRGKPGPGGSPYGLTTAGTGSTMVQQGLMSLTELGNKYSDNEMIGGMVAGTFGDIARTQANTGLAIQYNDAMYESMGRYQGNLENLRTANTSKLMAQEGAITGGLMDKQGKLQQEGLRVAGDEQRKGIREQGSENRLTLGEQGRQERMGIRERTGAQLRLRADARGAVRRGGARFFG
tara:strand:+ start:364 stop:1110 length:747 start_codon:yes stop_codon:yes gene_type:complete